jgi:formylglycine-generating enzyme required for sulfatase activity
MRSNDGCFPRFTGSSDGGEGISSVTSTLRERPHKDMVWIEGGSLQMGSEDFYPEERPVHGVEVSRVLDRPSSGHGRRVSGGS